MISTNMMDEFVKRFREAGSSNVESVILFGSAVTGEFHAQVSNLNLLCILRDASFPALEALAPAAKWWDKQKQPPPLCITRKELERSADVFTIELLDIQQHHRVLFGDDPVKDLRIPMDLHRVQVEYELREKLILLRRHILLADGDHSRLSEVLLRSAPSFSTLFRHVLIALGDTSQSTKRDAIQVLAQRLDFDATPMLQVLDVREKKLDQKKLDVRELCSRYLAAVERVTAAVDMAFDQDSAGRG